MSKPRNYGSQVQVFIRADLLDGERLGELMSFSYKSKGILKEHSSLGEAGIGTIDYIDNGGTLSFEMDKTDSKFAEFFSTMDKHARGGNVAGKRGKSPYFIIEQIITFLDDSKEVTTFEGVVLHDDEGSVSGRSEVYTEKFQGTYKRRRLDATGGEAILSSVSGMNLITGAIRNYTNLVANSTGYEDAKSIKFYGA